ncbi:MAG: hypothetical protein LC792_11490, partial [Actinobacteria bacterium]|nr:hypothetical protein [Actinomycetota bacterium]
MNGRGYRRGWAAVLLAVTGGLAGLGPVLLATAQPAWAFTAPVDVLKLGGGKFAFDPKVIEINVNDKVLWRNTKTDQRHTVTSDPGVAPFDSGEVPPGGSFEWKFKTKGTYTYHCEHHSEMTGTIEVKDPNDPVTTTTQPPPTTATTAPPTTPPTAPPPPTTTEPPTTTTTAAAPPPAGIVPPVPASSAAPPPAPTSSSVPSTTTTTTAPPTTPSS